MAFVKSENVFIDGVFSWARLVTPEEFEGERFWSITVHPTNESLEKVRELQARGIMNKMKKNDDGYYVRFKRNCFGKKKGVPFAMEPPKVFNKEKQLIDGMKVGNGTSGTIKLDCYGGDKPRKYFAARLDSIMVDELKEWQEDKDLSAVDRSRAEGLEERPSNVWD